MRCNTRTFVLSDICELASQSLKYQLFRYIAEDTRHDHTQEAQLVRVDKATMATKQQFQSCLASMYRDVTLNTFQIALCMCPADVVILSGSERLSWNHLLVSRTSFGTGSDILLSTEGHQREWNRYQKCSLLQLYSVSEPSNHRRLTSGQRVENKKNGQQNRHGRSPRLSKPPGVATVASMFGDEDGRLWPIKKQQSWGGLKVGRSLRHSKV